MTYQTMPETIRKINQSHSQDRASKQKFPPIRMRHCVSKQHRAAPTNDPTRNQRTQSPSRLTRETEGRTTRKPTPKHQEETSNSSTLPEESAKQPSDSEYPRISVAEATAVFQYFHLFIASSDLVLCIINLD